MCIISHTFVTRHGGEASYTAILKLYTWPTITADITFFFKACIHCASQNGGNRVPRPLIPTMNGTTPNSILNFYYIKLVPIISGENKYYYYLTTTLIIFCLLPFSSISAKKCIHMLSSTVLQNLGLFRPSCPLDPSISSTRCYVLSQHHRTQFITLTFPSFHSVSGQWKSLDAIFCVWRDLFSLI